MLRGANSAASRGLLARAQRRCLGTSACATLSAGAAALRPPSAPTASSRILQAFDARPHLHGLPGFFYTDADVYAMDVEHIFHREWLFAVHDAEVPEPGNFVTLTVGSHPVVVVRGSDGIIRAFHNVCRHRGYTLCPGLRGKAKAGGKRLVCPYHQWAYDVDSGSLLSARERTSKLDTSALSLKPVHSEVVHGYVFVSVAEEPPDFAPVAAMLGMYVEPFGLSGAKVAHQTRMVEKGNWKLVWENNRECYHCAAVHPQLRRSFPASTSGSLPTAEENAFAERAERRLGLPSAFVRASDFQYRATRLQLANQARSMTMDGRPAVRGLRLGRMPEEDVGDVLYYHYPTTWNHWMVDHALSFRVLPVSPIETELVTTWLVPADAREGVDYDLPTLTEVWEATNEQDRGLVENVQRGVASPAFTPGPFSPEHEDGVIDFLAWYEGVVRGRLTTCMA